MQHSLGSNICLNQRAKSFSGQGKGTSASPPFPDVAKSVLDSSPSPPIFLVSFFWPPSKAT